MANQRVLAGLVLALAIVAALAIGVSATLLLTRPEHTSATAPPATDVAAVAQPAEARAVAVADVSASTGVFINQVEVTREQLGELQRTYGAAPPQGRFWYDARSGLYGMWGHEAAGYIRPGHRFAQLPENASSGNTGVFINGRQINMTEALFFQRIFGAVYQGRWWLDGATGNLGVEGNDMPVANLVAAMQQAQRSSGSGEYRWRDDVNGASGGAVNGCVWVNMPGTSYTGSGC